MPCWNNMLGGRHLPGLWLLTEEQVQGERCHCGEQEQKPLHHLQGGPVKLLSQEAKTRSCGWRGAGFGWGWPAQRAGQGAQPGCRVRNGLIVKPLELLGGFWDGQGDSSPWLSPFLVPTLPSLRWMRVKPSDSAVPRGTNTQTPTQGSVTPMTPSGGHCWMLLAESRWWHLSSQVGPGQSRTLHWQWDRTQHEGGAGAARLSLQRWLYPAVPPLRAGCGTGRVQTGWWVCPGWACGATEEATALRSLSRQNKETGSHFLPGRGDLCVGGGAGWMMWGWVDDVVQSSSQAPHRSLRKDLVLLLFHLWGQGWKSHKRLAPSSHNPPAVIQHPAPSSHPCPGLPSSLTAHHETEWVPPNVPQQPCCDTKCHRACSAGPAMPSARARLAGTQHRLWGEAGFALH